LAEPGNAAPKVEPALSTPSTLPSQNYYSTIIRIPFFLLLCGGDPKGQRAGYAKEKEERAVLFPLPLSSLCQRKRRRRKDSVFLQGVNFPRLCL